MLLSALRMTDGQQNGYCKEEDGMAARMAGALVTKLCLGEGDHDQGAAKEPRPNPKVGPRFSAGGGD